MGVPLNARVTEVCNWTIWTILLFECEEHDSKGIFSKPIKVKPNSTKEISASRFLLNHEYGKNARTIRVKRSDCDDFEKEIFSGQDFLIHHRIIFTGEVDPLQIEKVRDPDAGGILAEFRRIKFVRYFWRPEAPRIPAACHPQADRTKVKVFEREFRVNRGRRRSSEVGMSTEMSTTTGLVSIHHQWLEEEDLAWIRVSPPLPIITDSTRKQPCFNFRLISGVTYSVSQSIVHKPAGILKLLNSIRC